MIVDRKTGESAQVDFGHVGDILERILQDLEAANAFAVIASRLVRLLPTPGALLAGSMAVVAVLSALVLWIVYVFGANLYYANAGHNAPILARATGQVVYGETLHQYLCHTADEYAQPGGFLKTRCLLHPGQALG